MANDFIDVTPAAEPESPYWICPACGYNSSGKFCSACGFPRPAAGYVPPAPEPEPEPAPAPAPDPVAAPAYTPVTAVPAAVAGAAAAASTPGYQAPQGAYQAPQGGYQAPQGGYQAPQGAYQQPYQQPYQQAAPGAKSRTTAGILAILLGAFGAHKFYLGYTTEALIMLAVCLLGACIAVGPIVTAIIGIIEGILYLTKTEEEFQATYVQGRKGWF